MKLGNLEILGTSHIAKESVEAVRSRIRDNKPAVVAVELDARRAYALIHGIKPKLSLKLVKIMGVKGFLFFAIASFLQKRLGRVVGVEPGSDMKAALLAAMEAKARIALIDRSLEVTMRRLSKSLTWRERFRFFLDLAAGPFFRDFQELRRLDLRKVPDSRLIERLLGELKKRYPGVYRVLVEERNEHMAAALAHIMQHHPDARVLAVVGAGHESDIIMRIKEKLDNRGNNLSP